MRRRRDQVLMLQIVLWVFDKAVALFIRNEQVVASLPLPVSTELVTFSCKHTLKLAVAVRPGTSI
jgi:hypothetical protein